MGRPQTQARVFVVTQHEADVAPEVMTGTIQVFDSDALCLDRSGCYSLVYVCEIYCTSEYRDIAHRL